MADRSAEPWYATAAYLYVLHLDGPALAWEYLRRHPDYRHDWLRRSRQPDAAGHWGLRLLEDPALDARDAHPAWFPDHDAVVQLYPDADPPPDALCFEFWKLPGHKHLTHDGKLFVIGAQGDGQLVNYRFRSPYYIVDRLFGAAELRLGADKGDVVRIERTDGIAGRN